MAGRNSHEHIVDISRTDYDSSSSSHDDQLSMINPVQHENRPLSSTEVSYTLSSPYRLDPGDFSFTRRGDGYNRRSRSLLDSGLWISVELIVTIGQIIAATVVLLLSRDEKPKMPLFEWILGYAAGCVASLPILYWRFHNRNRGIDQDTSQTHQDSSDPPEPVPYIAISASQSLDEENRQTLGRGTNYNQLRRSLIIRLDGLVDRFKMALDCFFAVWFVVGNIWIFGGHSSPSDAPTLYRLCVVFLTFSCIGYAMPFILCATICCCFPCIISFLGFREDLSRTRGATPETINALPVYKFTQHNNVKDDDGDGTGEGGILAAGTEKERYISEDDAACCICLARYADGDELRELPCTHVFHIECVDKWLKINASCPLCKSEIGESDDTDPDT